jgi:hypothetical protein
MRLGEIIQMQVSDVKCLDGIDYFDVTPAAIDPSDDEADASDYEKSLKTASSRRGIPVHETLSWLQRLPQIPSSIRGSLVT